MQCREEAVGRGSVMYRARRLEEHERESGLSYERLLLLIRIYNPMTLHVS